MQVAHNHSSEEFLVHAKFSLSNEIKKNIDNINTESVLDLHLSGKYHSFQELELDYQESELSELKNAIKCSTTLKSFTLAIDWHFKNLQIFLIDILTADVPLEALQIYGLDTAADAAIYDQLLTGLVNNTTLNTLILGSMVHGDNHVEFFCNNDYPTLNDSSVTDKEAVDFDLRKHIAATIFNNVQRSNQDFNILKLSGHKYGGGIHLLKSNVRLNHLGERSIVAIVEFLKHNKKLSSLSYSSQAFQALSEVGVRAIAELISCHQRLTSLDLSGNIISDAGAITIAKKLQRNNQLTALMLRENKIGNEGASAIAKILKHNTSLLELELAANKIKSSGIECIAHSLAENHTLLLLDLSGNQAGKAVVSLDTALDKNQTLQHLFYSTTRQFAAYRKSITNKLQNNVNAVKLKNIKQAKAFLWAMATIYIEWSQNSNSYLAKLPRELIDEYIMRYLLSSQNNDDTKYAVAKKNALCDFLKTESHLGTSQCKQSDELKAYIVESADQIANDYYELSSQPNRCSYMTRKADYKNHRSYTHITKNTNLVFAQFFQENNQEDLSVKTNKQNPTNNVRSPSCKRKRHSDTEPSTTSSSHFFDTKKSKREVIIIDDDIEEALTSTYGK